MLDGIDGARTWCGWGVLAHNTTKIAVLIEEREAKNALDRFATNAPAHSHRTTMPPSTTTEELCRLIPSPASPVTPPVRKRPENGGENDRRGRDRASRGHSEVPYVERASVPARGFSGRSN